MKNTDTDATIPLQHYWMILKKNISYLFILVFLGIGFSALFSYFILTPKYESNVQMIADIKQSEDNKSLLNDLNANILLINTYKDFITSNKLLSEVQKKLTQEGISLTADEIKEMISIQQAQNSQVFNLNVSSDNPQKSKLLADTIAKVFQEQLAEYHPTETIRIVSPATTPKSSVSPNHKLNILIGMILGGLIGLATVFLSDFFDQKIHSSSFVAEVAELPILGTLPDVSEDALWAGKNINFEYYRRNPREFKRDFSPRKNGKRRRRKMRY